MRRNVTVMDCGRCKREETIPADDKSDRSISVTFQGKTARLEDLCGPCLEATKNAVAQIFKPMEKKSPDRKKKLNDGEVDVHIEVAPASPLAQAPHNGSGAKKEGVTPPSHAPVRAPRA